MLTSLFRQPLAHPRNKDTAIPSRGGGFSGKRTAGAVQSDRVQARHRGRSGREGSKEVLGTVRSGWLGRLLDRHIGRMLLWGIGIVRRPRPLPNAPQNIALSVFGALGDALLASALAVDIRRVMPDVRITLVVTATNQAMAPLLPALDAVLVVPVGRLDRAVRLLRDAGFDLMIDCNQWLRISAVHAALVGCFAVGFRTAGQGRHFAYDRAVDHLATRHELDNYRALLVPLGIVPEARPAVRIPTEAHTTVAALLQSDPQGAPGAGMSGAGTVVFHPWAGGRNAWLKEWPVEYWVTLADALQSHGFDVCVTGGPGDVANTGRLVSDAAKRRVTIRPVAGTLTLPQVTALLSGARVVVAVNTGIMHLAAAVGAKLVALHGPTNPARWGPVSDNATVLIPENGPSGYLHLGFEFPKQAVECMSTIPVETVLDAVLRMVMLDDRQAVGHGQLPVVWSGPPAGR